jgi:hypothetical protein
MRKKMSQVTEGEKIMSKPKRIILYVIKKFEADLKKDLNFNRILVSFQY